ncbi:MAG TPA: hypothetical protein DDY86_04035 [Syntrophaceae bacterium]|nr:hypothetical protein [Syntrophaceae bacterium]
MGSVKNGKKRIKGKPFAPGNPGRPKGAVNKFTSLKDSFLDVFKMLGGTQGLYDWAKSSKRNQAMFYAWIIKMLPAGAMIDKTPDAEAIEAQLKAIAEAMKP